MTATPANVADSAPLSTRRFTDADTPAVVELLQAAFGTWPYAVASMTAERFFRWKHAECPFGESVRVVALDGDRLVGFTALLPWQLRAGERAVATMRGTDIAVHPDHQRRGVSLALIEASRTERERIHPGVFDFTWANPNKLSFSRTIATGSGAAGALPLYVRVHVPTRLRRALGAARSAGKSYPMIDAPSAAEALADGLDPRLLAPSRGRSARFETLKGIEYLRWRYGRLSEYQAVGEDGLAIFRTHMSGSYRVVEVCELLIAPGDRRKARELLRAVKRVCGTELVTACFPSPASAAVCGYLRAPGGATVTARPLREGLALDPTSHDAWALSLGDLELI